MWGRARPIAPRLHIPPPSHTHTAYPLPSPRLVPRVIADMETVLKDAGELGVFYKTILVRCLREDRVVPAMLELFRSMDGLTVLPGEEDGV